MDQTKIRSVQDLGALIRRERHHRQLSQAELAARAGVSRRFVYQLETGTRETFPIGKVLQILRRLNLDLQLVSHRTE